MTSVQLEAIVMSNRRGPLHVLWERLQASRGLEANLRASIARLDLCATRQRPGYHMSCAHRGHFALRALAPLPKRSRVTKGTSALEAMKRRNHAQAVVIRIPRVLCTACHALQESSAEPTLVAQLSLSRAWLAQFAQQTRVIPDLQCAKEEHTQFLAPTRSQSQIVFLAPPDTFVAILPPRQRKWAAYAQLDITVRREPRPHTHCRVRPESTVRRQASLLKNSALIVHQVNIVSLRASLCQQATAVPGITALAMLLYLRLPFTAAMVMHVTTTPVQAGYARPAHIARKALRSLLYALKVISVQSNLASRFLARLVHTTER